MALSALCMPHIPRVQMRWGLGSLISSSWPPWLCATFPILLTLEKFPFSLRFLCSAFSLGGDVLTQGNGNNFIDFNGIWGADREFPGLLMGTDHSLLIQNADYTHCQWPLQVLPFFWRVMSTLALSEQHFRLLRWHSGAHWADNTERNDDLSLKSSVGGSWGKERCIGLDSYL